MEFILPSGDFSIREIDVRRKKFVVSNRGAIKALLMFSQIIGVCSISATLQTNRWHAMHNAFLFVLFSTISIYSFVTDVKVDHTKAPNVSIFREIVNRYLYYLFGIICIALGYLRSGKLISYFKLILEADKELLQLSDFSDALSKRYLVILNVAGLSGCIAILGVALGTEDALQAFVYFLFVLIIFATLGPFIGGLRLLRKRFECINTILSSDFRNDFDNKLILTISSKYRIVALCHDKLCDAADCLNACFTVQMLGYFTLVFLGTLFAVFGDFRVFFGTEEQQEDGVALLLLKNSYISIYLVVFSVFTLNACSSTCDEANETGRLIHKIINSGRSVNSVENLRTFSLQLMHRNLSFHACYMFNLDYTLLYTLIGASTTYMVILIQFDLAKPVESTTCNETASS